MLSINKHHDLRHAKAKKVNKNKMRVLQVLPRLGTGGVERASVDLANALVAQHPEIPTYIASYGGELENELAPGVNHIKLKLCSKNPAIILHNAHRLLKIIKKFNIDVIHARSRAPAWSAYFASKWANIPFVTTYHAIYGGHNRVKRFYNGIMARGKPTIAVSEFIEKHVHLHYPQSEVIRINEGIDTDHFSPKDTYNSSALKKSLGIPEKTKVLLMASRITHNKGHHLVFQALGNLAKDTPFYLICVGNAKPDYLNFLKMSAERFGISEKVLFVSHINDLRPYYSMAHTVLMPSIVPEALGRVTLEALSMERVVIASNIGGNKETCLNGQVGFLFDPQDVNDLTLQLQNALSLRAPSYKKMTTKARQHVISNFSFHNMIKKTIEVYQNLSCRL
jgi:glycosyltransferase involved in cell wall biosynthesis